MNEQLGNLFIVAAPSGGGKTSLVKRLVEEMDDLVVSISHTTRDKRPGERDGEQYYFIDDAEFQQMIVQNAFVEHAYVFEKHYGTSHTEIDDRLKQGIDVVLDIDWQGALQIKNHFKTAVGIFILPPNLKVLEQRLIDRQRDSAEVIAHRMQRACEEMSHYAEFDYLVVNDHFEQALQDLKAIIAAARLKIERQAYVQRKLLSLLLTSQ